MTDTLKAAPFALILSATISLAACGQSTPQSPPEPAARTASMETKPSAPPLSERDLGRACRAAVAALNGRDPKIIKVETVSAGIAKVAYRRPDDGKVWKNQCRVEGDRVVWAAVDLSGPGSGPGRWRTDPADEVVTYEITDPTVTIRITYSDGSGAQESYTIE